MGMDFIVLKECSYLFIAEAVDLGWILWISRLNCCCSPGGIEALNYFMDLGEEYKFLESHSWKTKQLYFYNACFKNCCFPKISMRFAVNQDCSLQLCATVNS